MEDFAELGKYFDMPMKTYSSGMRSRLGFGLSMAFHFDYYLVDEVIAVGDAKFKKKCEDTFINNVKNSHILLVSHSMRLLKQYCDSAIVFSGANECQYIPSIDDALAYSNN